MANKARIEYSEGKLIYATDVTDKNKHYYCNTKGCTAEMIIVSMGNADAHFRSKHVKDHKYSDCVRNSIVFNPDKYDKNLFSLNSFKSRILGLTQSLNIHRGKGGGGKIGSSSKIAPNTLKSIYAAYLSSLESEDDTFGDCKFSDFMRCKENYKDFVANPDGFYIVEGTYYFADTDKGYLLINIPDFVYGVTTAHARVNFSNLHELERLNNYICSLDKKYHCKILVAAEWTKTTVSAKYMAECMVTKRTQYLCLGLD